MLLLVKIWEK